MHEEVAHKPISELYGVYNYWRLNSDIQKAVQDNGGCDMVQAWPAKQVSRSVEPAHHDIRNLRKVIIKNIPGTHRMPILTWVDWNADADFGEN